SKRPRGGTTPRGSDRSAAGGAEVGCGVLSSERDFTLAGPPCQAAAFVSTSTRSQRARDSIARAKRARAPTRRSSRTEHRDHAADPCFYGASYFDSSLNFFSMMAAPELSPIPTLQ